MGDTGCRHGLCGGRGDGDGAFRVHLIFGQI